MAKRKTYKRKAYKKSYVRKTRAPSYKKKSYKRTSVKAKAKKNWISTLPFKQVCRMQYHSMVPINTTSGPRIHSFYGNSVYRPDITLGIAARSPKLYGDMTAIYQSWRVVSSELRSNFRNTANLSGIISVEKSTSPSPTLFGTTPGQGVDPFLTTNISAKKFSSYLLTNRDDVTIISKASTAKMFGVNNISDPIYEGSFNTYPTDMFYYHVQLSDPHSAVSVIQGELDLMFTVYVEFFNPYPPAYD